MTHHCQIYHDIKEAWEHLVKLLSVKLIIDNYLMICRISQDFVVLVLHSYILQYSNKKWS